VLALSLCQRLIQSGLGRNYHSIEKLLLESEGVSEEEGSGRFDQLEAGDCLRTWKLLIPIYGDTCSSMIGR